MRLTRLVIDHLLRGSIQLPRGARHPHGHLPIARGLRPTARYLGPIADYHQGIQTNHLESTTWAEHLTKARHDRAVPQGTEVGR